MNLYTARELKLNLARCRQRPLPERTFQYWKSRLGIVPDERGFYHQSDFDTLRELIRAINRGMTINQFVDLQKEKANATRSEQSDGRDKSLHAPGEAIDVVSECVC